MEDLKHGFAWSAASGADQESIPTRFVVDHRERSCGVPLVLSSMENVEVRFEHLPLGDYLVDDVLLFERKTLLDLTASISDARLFRQATRLAADSRHAAFILEGTAVDLRSSRMRREAIQGALITVSLMFGVPLLRSVGPRETARMMVYAARQTRSWSTGALPRRARRPKRRRRAQLHVLQGLPGIGPKRAANLLDAFGSVEAVFAATANDLIAIDGVGTSTAQAIRWVVSDERAQYCCRRQPQNWRVGRELKPSVIRYP